MSILPYLDLDIVSIILLFSILFLSQKKINRNSNDKINFLYTLIILITIIILFLEILSIVILEYNNSELIFINKLINSLVFSLAPIVTLIWLLYLKSWIKVKYNYLLLLTPAIINIILCLFNFKFNFIFLIDESNQYHRGPVFYLPLTIAYIYLIFCLILLFLNKGSLDKKEFKALSTFSIIPSIAALIQVLIPNVLLIWNSIAGSLIVFYIFLQERRLVYDQLTRAQNRLGLEIALSDLISSDNENFSMIFIDLDSFKSINDKFGHSEGDVALLNTVKLIKLTFKLIGEVFRLGGDEFVILVHTNNPERIERLIHKLQMNFFKYNNASTKPYTLQFSYGYDIYRNDFNDFHDYISHIDTLMYENKNAKKAR